MEPDCKKRRTSPAVRFADLPVDVVRLIQDKAYDATTRVRLQSVVPEAMWSRHETDPALSLIEYCERREMLAENKTIMELLFARTERSARDIRESMAGFPAFVRGKNLLADIAAERLRDPAELPTAQDIEADFNVSFWAIYRLGGSSVEFFDKFVATDMFGHIKVAFPRGRIELHRQVCCAENKPLLRRVRALAVDDLWFRCDEKSFTTRVSEVKMDGNRDADVLELFKTAASSLNMDAARSMFDRASKIRL